MAFCKSSHKKSSAADADSEGGERRKPPRSGHHGGWIGCDRASKKHICIGFQKLACLNLQHTSRKSAAQKVPSGACSRITAIELLNASRQALTFTGPLGLSLLAPAWKSFYSDPAYTTASSSPALSGMTGKADFHFKGSATGSVAISANLLTLFTTSQTENAASPTPSPTPTSTPTLTPTQGG